MNFLKYLSNLILIMIALAITILVSLIIPENQFKHYKLDLDSTWAKEPDRQEYLVDLNNDREVEIIRHNHINKPGHSMELVYKNRVSVIGIFGEKAFIISRSLKFADVNHDGISEILFVAVDNRKASLFILEFDFKSGKNPPVKSIQAIGIDSVHYQNNIPDVVNYDILTNNSEVILDLQAGYYVQPRNIYKYNVQTEKLVRTPRSSIVNKHLELVTIQNRAYLLAKNVVVTANTWSPEQAEIFRISKNADSLKIYDRIKSYIYAFGDFSSYILLYNPNLEFAFRPVEFRGWTNYTLSGILMIGNTPHIIALTNNQLNDSTQRFLTLCSLHGNIRRQEHLAENYTGLFTDTNTFVLQQKQTLDVYSAGFKKEKKIDGISFAAGFYDLTPNPGREFIGFEKNELVVYSDGFRSRTSFKIAQEFAPWPETAPEVFQKNGKTSVLFHSRLFYYLFTYETNGIAWLKYPFYAAIFLFWFALLLLLLRMNSKRHLREKQLLETIVSERTQELQLKNRELASQKEEIQAQTAKINEQYRHLEKLDHFKETLTHALVHDLKNPLSQILLTSNNELIKLSARKMLQLIMNMLDVERYQHTELKLRKDTHSLRNLLETSVGGLEISMKEKNIGLRRHFNDYKVQADREVMVRVFDNLLSNAIRYSPLNQNIEIFAEPSGGGFLLITMRNQGDPIPEEVRPYIFDKYRQFGHDEPGSYRTTGLGLTFCKMAVEAHGGKIGAGSHEGRGTDFWFTIPCVPLPVEPDEPETPVDGPTATLRLSEAGLAALKEVVPSLKACELYEISRFHEILDSLKESPETDVNQWVSLVFSAVYAQNKNEFNRLIKLAENEQE